MEDGDTNVDSEKELSHEQKLELARAKNISTSQNTIQKSAVPKTFRQEIDLFEDEEMRDGSMVVKSQVEAHKSSCSHAVKIWVVVYQLKYRRRH
ncbi:hypothetical protein TNCV_26861 [Trichonephila clavipes]|uniref:Uncharacterized protein n=1 Tax=Trichonephila clavipes TaxID=2585209 RepID=A0A8X7BMF4_TRICX|nr:hypothetical protein TNCV_26861 [Trichonephila clavipes]